mmetsp:Transcript_65400/g.132784  ORF Transcript_65400/g.132784 Transcript_65400/m.132784 type:complete len:127 (+) Transcript_65400:160-540(+)
MQEYRHKDMFRDDKCFVENVAEDRLVHGTLDALFFVIIGRTTNGKMKASGKRILCCYLIRYQCLLIRDYETCTTRQCIQCSPPSSQSPRLDRFGMAQGGMCNFPQHMGKNARIWPDWRITDAIWLC